MCRYPWLPYTLGLIAIAVTGTAAGAAQAPPVSAPPVPRKGLNQRVRKAACQFGRADTKTGISCQHKVDRLAVAGLFKQAVPLLPGQVCPRGRLAGSKAGWSRCRVWQHASAKRLVRDIQPGLPHRRYELQWKDRSQVPVLNHWGQDRR